MASDNVTETANVEEAAYAVKAGVPLINVVPGMQATFRFDNSGGKASEAFNEWARGNARYQKYELADTLKDLQAKAQEAQRTGKAVAASTAPKSISDRTVEKAFEADPAGYIVAKAKRGEELNATEKAVAWELFKRIVEKDMAY